jgi:hypothetical protein
VCQCDLRLLTSPRSGVLTPDPRGWALKMGCVERPVAETTAVKRYGHVGLGGGGLQLASASLQLALARASAGYTGVGVIASCLMLDAPQSFELVSTGTASTVGSASA